MRRTALPPDAYDWGFTTQFAQIFAFEGDVPFSWSDGQKLGATLQAISPVNLDSFQVNHEVLCFEARFSATTVASDVDITSIWTNLDTGAQIFTNTIHLTKEEINGWTDYFFIRFWIGKCSWEINGPMNVMLNVMIDSADPNVTGDGQFYMEVTGEPVPPQEMEIQGIDVVPDSFKPPKTVALSSHIENISDEEIRVDIEFWTMKGLVKNLIMKHTDITFAAGQVRDVSVMWWVVDWPEGTWPLAVKVFRRNTTQLLDELTIENRYTIEGEAPPPPETKIHGTIIDDVTSSRIIGATVSFYGYSTISNHIGQYTLELPDFSGASAEFKAEKSGYETYTEMITMSPGDDILKNVRMIPADTPPPEWKMFDPPPADFPATFIPWLHELDDACYDNNPEAVKTVLRNYAWEHGSPIVFLAALAMVVKAIMVITTVLGSKAFASFLFEETLQTIDMAIWEARSAEQWDLAQEAVNKKRELFETTWWDEFLSWIPGANVIMAVEKFKDASLFKLDLDQELIDRHSHYGQAPSTGDIQQYIAALDSGNPPDLYAPRADCILIANVNTPGGEIIAGDMGWSTLFPVTLNIPSGIIDVTIKSEGYADKTKTMNIDPYEIHTESFWLDELVVPPEKGTLHVTCNVSTADVYVNGTKRGVTPLTYVLDPGQYHILVSKFQHTSYETDVTIIANQTTEVSAEIMPETPPPEKALLQVGSNPQGASIFRDDADTGQVTQHTFELDPGTYKITLKLADYPDAEQTVTLIAGQTFEMYYDFTIPYYPPEVEVEVTMTPITHEYNAWKYRFRAKDAVTGAEINAKIFIDDEDTGKWSPWYFYLEELKTYVVRLERYGYHPATVTITTEQLPVIP